MLLLARAATPNPAIGPAPGIYHFCKMQARSLLRRLAVARPPLMARGMGGGHGHAKPQYTGIEATVRQYFPENYHVRRAG